MKSYCLKTENEEIIEYLLNKFSKLDFPNIYYCNKSFKIYENLIVHYKEDNIEKFENIISDFIKEVILIFYQEKILKRIINVNYFYFDEFERTLIAENCEEFITQDEEEINETIFKEIKDYIKENRNMY